MKFRDNKLDTKWKRSRFEIDSKSKEYMNFSGGVLESTYLLAKKNKDERKNMNVIAQLLLSNYLTTNLTSTSSYSYPKLFSLNQKLIIEWLRN